MSSPTLQHDDTGEWLDIGLNAGSNGGALYTGGNGRSSVGRTRIHDLDGDVELVKFAGVAGSFQADHGARGRPIVWHGAMRLSEVGLAAVLAQRDWLRTAGGTFTFTDWDGTAYASCALNGFEIGERMRIAETIGDVEIVWRLEYRIVLYQLEV